jgi:hypothetical protein
MSLTTPIRGGCACGEIRYESSEQPLFTWLCHCQDCRKATGSAVAANVFFTPSAMTFTGPEPTSYTTTGLSGQSLHHLFCSACGSPIGTLADAFPIMRGIRASSLDDPSGLKPMANLWNSSALPWDRLDPDLLQFETQPTEEEFGRIMASLG